MNITEAVKRLAGFLNIRQLGERIFSDLVDTWWIIALSLSGKACSPTHSTISPTKGACILSFLWILLMRYLSSLMVWLSILCVTVGLGALVWYCGYRLYLVTISAHPEAAKNILQVIWCWHQL